ncbi:MAG: hypothetical protein K2O99_07050 [Lachnospiraceae bacterium]|nr:hypothetical protein [Lachnospiraceae bacterium]
MYSRYKNSGIQALFIDRFHRDKGYLLSFNFNKKKEIGVKEIQVGGKTIVEAVV